MKRTALFLAVLLALSMYGGALAAEDDTLYPTDIVEYMEGEHHRIDKIYVLSGDSDPAEIPTADFEREGCVYTLLDMVRRDMTETDSKTYTETVTVQSRSKDRDDILPLLDETMEVTTEDGYSGVLTLDEESIGVQAAGYGTSTRTVSATRSYPNLSDADTALIPKTTEDSGRTLELADVQWQEAGGYYHATATYTGTATSRYVTGYTATAEYKGEVTKTVNDAVEYTAIFGGSPIAPERTGAYQLEQLDEPDGGAAWLIPVLIILGIVAVGVVVLLLWHAAHRGARRYKR